MIARNVSATACSLIATAVIATAAFAADERSSPARIAPPQSHPGGETYGGWAARWWHWVLVDAPPDDHPLLDSTGRDCAEGQLGHVWFIGGNLAGLGFPGGPVTRSCQIPAGTALFFPLVNSFYGAFLNDPPEQRTEEFIRSQVACAEDAEPVLKIDGTEVEDVERYFVESPLFDIRLPDDNIVGLTEEVVPELLLSPSVTAGYYIFLYPLPPGEHEINWKASACDTAQDVTYRISVGKAGEQARQPRAGSDNP